MADLSARAITVIHTIRTAYHSITLMMRKHLHCASVPSSPSPSQTGPTIERYSTTPLSPPYSIHMIYVVTCSTYSLPHTGPQQWPNPAHLLRLTLGNPHSHSFSSISSQIQIPLAQSTQTSSHSSSHTVLAVLLAAHSTNTANAALTLVLSL